MRTIPFAGILGSLPSNLGDLRAEPLGFLSYLVELRDESAHALTIGFVRHIDLPAGVCAIGTPESGRQNARRLGRGRGLGPAEPGFDGVVVGFFIERVTTEIP